MSLLLLGLPCSHSSLLAKIFSNTVASKNVRIGRKVGALHPATMVHEVNTEYVKTTPWVTGGSFEAYHFDYQELKLLITKLMIAICYETH